MNRAIVILVLALILFFVGYVDGSAFLARFPWKPSAFLLFVILITYLVSRKFNIALPYALLSMLVIYLIIGSLVYKYPLMFLLFGPIRFFWSFF